MTTQTDLIQKLATDHAREAIRDGARAPWGDGETLPDVRDLARSGVVIPEDRDERNEIARIYDRKFREVIDAEASVEKAVVMDYDTGTKLAGGSASLELIAASADAPSGAVPAYRDADGVWQYVQPSEVEHHRRNLKLDVITVYIDDRR